LKDTVVAQAQEITQRQSRCVDRAAHQTNAEVARLAASADNLAELEIKNALANGHKAVAACKAEANRENEEVVRRQIEKYNLQAQEQKDRTALMVTLTSSKIH
jgi:hypothetical protein